MLKDLLINGIKLFGRMGDHMTATAWFVAWLLTFIYFCLLRITRTQIYLQIHDGIKEDEVGRDVARFRAMRKTYKTLNGKPERKTSHGRNMRRREDIVKLMLRA